MYRGKPIAGIINKVFEKGPAVWGVVTSDDGIDKGFVIGRKRKKGNKQDVKKLVTLSRSHTGAAEVSTAEVFVLHSMHVPDVVSEPHAAFLTDVLPLCVVIFPGDREEPPARPLNSASRGLWLQGTACPGRQCERLPALH